MRILIVAHGVADQSLLGGPGRVAAAHARGLAGRGHDVRVLTSDLVVKGRTAEPTFDLLGPGVEARWVHARTLKRWPGTVGPIFGRPSAAIREAMLAVDIVHCHEWPYALVQLTRRAAKKAGIPCFIQPHGSIQRRTGGNRLLHSFADSLHPVKADDILIVGSEQEDAEIRAIVRQVPSLHNLVNPMPPSALADDAPEVVARRESWQLPAGCRAILYAHRLAPNKGLDIAIEALALLPAYNHLIVIGDDSVFPAFVQSCRELVRRLGVEDRVRFIGPVARLQIDEVILAADLFILPARRDTFPLMVLHALACGRPVVMTNTCQSIDQLAGAVLTVAPDPKALAEAIDRIDDGELRRLSVAGRQRLLERFSPESVVVRLEELYALALSRAASGV